MVLTVVEIGEARNREAGPPNHHDDKVDSDFTQFTCGREG